MNLPFGPSLVAEDWRGQDEGKLVFFDNQGKLQLWLLSSQSILENSRGSVVDGQHRQRLTLIKSYYNRDVCGHRGNHYQ